MDANSSSTLFDHCRKTVPWILFGKSDLTVETEGMVGFLAMKTVKKETKYQTLTIPREDWGTLGNIRED